MFRDLESNSEQLKLNGYGISITSLEEVFMKVGSETPTGQPAPKPIMNNGGFGSEDGDSMNCESKQTFILQ